MTDEEAYELLVKYSGRNGIAMQSEMLSHIGVEKTMDYLLSQYKTGVPLEFEKWLFQGLTYLNNKLKNQAINN